MNNQKQNREIHLTHLDLSGITISTSFCYCDESVYLFKKKQWQELNHPIVMALTCLE